MSEKPDLDALEQAARAEPTTEAGRRLAADYAQLVVDAAGFEAWNPEGAYDRILAVEQEAAAAAVREADALREALRECAEASIANVRGAKYQQRRYAIQYARAALSPTEPAAGEREP